MNRVSGHRRTVSHFKGIYFAFYENNVIFFGPLRFFAAVPQGATGKDQLVVILLSPLSSCYSTSTIETHTPTSVWNCGTNRWWNDETRLEQTF